MKPEDGQVSPRGAVRPGGLGYPLHPRYYMLKRGGEDEPRLTHIIIRMVLLSTVPSQIAIQDTILASARRAKTEFVSEGVTVHDE